uniref:Ig-like domain-containing protein n=1 Tax=Glossina palpalis gambiensis TaxID=67801 RepID=A0A1B0AX54_9MUSC
IAKAYSSLITPTNQVAFVLLKCLTGSKHFCISNKLYSSSTYYASAAAAAAATGLASSSTISVTAVSAFEPDFVIPLENVTVAQGRDATFTCVVNNLGGHRVSGDSTPARYF